MDPLYDWFQAFLKGGTRLGTHYAAIKKDGRTYALGSLSYIEWLRLCLKKDGLDGPVTAVLVIDGPIEENAPKNKWIGITDVDIAWYEHRKKLDIPCPSPVEAFNQTVRAMDHVAKICGKSVGKRG